MKAVVFLMLSVAIKQCWAQDELTNEVCDRSEQMTDIGISTADYIINAVYDLHEPSTTGYGCGEISPAGVRIREVFRYAISTVNQIYGTSFGMRLYDVCGSPSRGLSSLQGMLPETRATEDECSDVTAPRSSLSLGFISASTSQVTRSVSKYASSLPVSVVSPTAMDPQLSDKAVYETFMRTTPTRSLYAKVVVELLQKLEWQKVTIFYLDNDYGRRGYEEFVQATYQNNLCVSAAIPLPVDGDINTFRAELQALGSSTQNPAAILISDSTSATNLILRAAEAISITTQWVIDGLSIKEADLSLSQLRGALVVVPRYGVLTEFQSFINSASQNIKNEISRQLNCQFTGGTGSCESILSSVTDQDPHIMSTLLSVILFAETVTSVCGSGALCSTLRDTYTAKRFHEQLKSTEWTFPADFRIASLRNKNFRFDNNGDLIDSEFTVYNVQKSRTGSTFEFVEAYSYTSAGLSNGVSLFYDRTRGDLLPNKPTATCATLGCDNCLLPRRSVTFHYTPGDLVLASLVTAHLPGNAPLSCGPALAPRLAALVAAEYAVINPGLTLRGVSLGSLVADVCPNEVVAEGFLSDLLSGNNRLVDSAGTIISGANIQAFVNQNGDHEAHQISKILSQFRIPEIQTSATEKMGGVMMSGSMSMMEEYISKAVPNNHVIFTAIASLLKQEEWNYVQVATSRSESYHQATETFRKIAAEYGVCVVSVTNLDNGYTEAALEVQSSTKSSVVIVIADNHQARGFLRAIEDSNQANELQIISGTLEWGQSPYIIKDLTKASEGLILFDLDLPLDIGFSNYLTSFVSDRTELSKHPFVKELFEVTNECSLDPSTRGIYARICGSSETFNAYQGTAPLVIESVKTVVSAIDEILSDLCGANYQGLCSEFRAANMSTLLAEKMRNVPTNNQRFGILNGEGTTNLLFYRYSAGQYNQIGRFSSTEERFLNRPTNLPDVKYQCSHTCVECNYIFNLNQRLYVPGDWLIAGMFSASESGPVNLQPYQCGDIKTVNGPLYSVAMAYALDKVNSGEAPVAVSGIKFGGLALDHCNNDGRASLLVSDIYSGFWRKDSIHPERILSWITDNSGSSLEAASLLNPLGVAMVSPSATLPSLTDYENFFRTIQGDATVAAALLKTVESLGISTIQVVHSANDYGRGALATVQSVARQEELCISGNYEMADPSDAAGILTNIVNSKMHVVIVFMGTSDTRAFLDAVAANSDARQNLLILLPEPFESIVRQPGIGDSIIHPLISIQLSRFEMPDYEEYLDSSPISNPFFAEYYMVMLRCNLPGHSRYGIDCPTPLPKITDRALTNFDMATINAVYATVDALDRTVQEYCQPDYTEPCPAFWAATDMRERFNLNLRDASFVVDATSSFQFLEKEGDVRYSIVKFNKTANQYAEMGNYAGVALTLSDPDVQQEFADVLFECTSCINCVQNNLKFSYTAGDIYLAGLFDTHFASYDPFLCGDIKTLHGFLLVEAFHFALEQVNSKTGQFMDILKGVTLGGIGLDPCTSPVRGGYLVNNINNGFTPLEKNGRTIPASEIDVYLASYESLSSAYLARILTDLKAPQISYASKSTFLSDERIYPYFYRTVPSDEKQVEAILSFLDSQDLRYVQVVYEDNIDGQSAMMVFKEKATKYRICVAQYIEHQDLNVVSREESADVVVRILEKPEANMIVTFLGTGNVNSLLKAVRNSEKARDTLRFFGSEKWADNSDATDGADDQVGGSVTIRLDNDDVQAFERYINEKTLANSGENPWFEEYYQKIHGCYTSATKKGGYIRQCALEKLDTINSPLYQQDPGAVHVINAVYAAAHAIDHTLRQKCGVDYSAVCQAYRKDTNRREEIANNLESVTFTDVLNRPFHFSDHQALTNYRYYSVSQGFLGRSIYSQIGTYNTSTSKLTLDTSYSSKWDAGCEREDACTECPDIRNQGRRYMFSPNTPNDDRVTVVGFFDIHKQGVDPYRCGDLNLHGVQQFLAFYYGLNSLFSDKLSGSTLQKNIRLLVVDTCSNSLRVDQDLFGLLQGKGLCNSNFPEDAMISVDNIGTVFTSGLTNTMAASRVLEGVHLTYLNSDSRSVLLDNKHYLIRTITPLSVTMRKLAELLRSLGWTYVDLVYEDSRDGLYPYQMFDGHAEEFQICRGSAVSIRDDDSDSEVEELLQGLNGDLGSSVVVLMGDVPFIKRVLEKAADLGFAEDYTWVLVSQHRITDMVLRHLLADVSVESLRVRVLYESYLHYQVEEFQNYLKELSDGSNINSGIRSDWLIELRELYTKCSTSTGSNEMCDDMFDKSSGEFVQDSVVLNTLGASYVISDGLNSYLSDVLGATPPPLNSLHQRGEIMKNMARSRWDITDTVNVEADGQEQLDLAIDSDHGQHYWQEDMNLFYAEIVKDGDNITIENKVRNDLESPMQRAGASRCLNNDFVVCGCTDYSIDEPQAQTAANRMRKEPRNYYYYSSDDEKQYDWPIWALAVGVATILGLIVAVILFLVLLFAYPRKGGTSILGYMMIIGVIAVYAINFAFFFHASDATCGARRFLMGVFYMLLFAPLLIKAIDNWRFGHVDYADRRYSGISSAFSLFLSALGLVLIQCIIPIMWLILVHPTATHYAMENDKHDQYWCDPIDDYDLGLVLSFTFVVFIVIVTGVFSALAYDSKTNNYESRWILFGSIATIGCFMVWMVVSTNAGPTIRDPAVTIANFVNATILLVIIPIRKTFLMCRVRREEDDKKMVNEVLYGNGAPYDNANGSAYANPTFDLADYDNLDRQAEF